MTNCTNRLDIHYKYGPGDIVKLTYTHLEKGPLTYIGEVESVRIIVDEKGPKVSYSVSGFSDFVIDSQIVTQYQLVQGSKQ